MFVVKGGEQYFCRCGDWVLKSKWRDHMKYLHPVEYEALLVKEHYNRSEIADLNAIGVPPDYIVCYTHGMKITKGKCAKGKQGDECRVLGYRSKYNQFVKMMSKRNDHDHKWYKTNQNEDICYVCKKKPIDCGIYNVMRKDIKFLYIDKKQNPMDSFF